MKFAFVEPESVPRGAEIQLLAFQIGVEHLLLKGARLSRALGSHLISFRKAGTSRFA
jgi:hypothetical protein